MIDYTEIKNRLDEKGINAYAIKKYKPGGKTILAQSTLSKIYNNDGEQLSTGTIEDICQLLQCQPLDLLQDWHIDLNPELSMDYIRAKTDMELAESSKKRNKQIEECKASGNYTIIPAVNFTEIMIVGENHKEIAEKLQADLKGTTKSQEIIIRNEYEKESGCVITAKPGSQKTLVKVEIAE